jgi:folate-binding protein YgfZ
MSDLQARMAAAREGTAVGPALARGLLRVSGKDRHDLLHRISTQHVKGLAPGETIHLAFLDVKGRVVADAVLFASSDDLLLQVEPEVTEPLRAHLARFILRDQVKLEDVSAALRVVPALGLRGLERARAIAPAGSAFTNPRRGTPALDVVLAPSEAAAFRDALLSGGATPLDEGDLEVLRVMAGLPRQGADIDAARLPMEAALVQSAVSFDKGCYIGQEVVLRGTFRGQIQKGLVQLALPEGAGPGTRLELEGREVGVVTSAVEGPEGRLGLGYLRRAHWKEGERLATPAGEAVVRRVLVTEKER